MGIVGSLFHKFENNKAEGIAACNKVSSFVVSVNDKFKDKTDFIDTAWSLDVKNTCTSLQNELRELPFTMALTNKEIKVKKQELDTLSKDIVHRVSVYNDEVAGILSEKARKVIGNVEGRRLDDQQMKCIIKPGDSHLVIAGAGTGKTTTIVGKVKYLINSGICDCKDILVLSFTNASASEMRDRINKETGQQIEALTFHKLGLNIIKSANGITPKITKIVLSVFCKEKLIENMQDTKYLVFLCRYFLFNPKYEKSEFEFQNQKEYEEYLQTNPPATLKGDVVKSYGEMDIANFLYMNGIEYEYEKEYEYDTRTEERYQYYPDFYLTAYGIYIEYFGINENGEVPRYFVSRDGKSPSKEYQEGIEWKRNLHKTNNTRLVECYSYERFRGELLSQLKEKLKTEGVEFKPVSTEVLWNKVAEKNSKNVMTGVAELIGTIIALMKSNELNTEQLREKCRKFAKPLRNTILIDLIAPIYDAYLKELKQRGEIDFNDMINDAAHMIRDGKYKNPYKYVIVDEYQDISRSRFNLLKALRESAKYKLFCVGDDWQSIYRFAGSDMDYILNFSKYWGATEYSKIETTYRFTDSLIDISGRFVMRNPAQIKKNIKGIPSKVGFAMGEIKGVNEPVAIKFMLNRLRELPMNSTVFFIGRYMFDSKLLSGCDNLKCTYDATTQEAKVVLPERSDLKMQFITAHRSKGLQADFVFILNNKERGMGFPSKIQDDPIVDCLLEAEEAFPFAEERRLFYVALTRAKIKTFLVVVNRNESVFASEMENQYADKLKKEAFSCPLCGSPLIKKTGPFGEFYGCSNYQRTGCEFKRKIKTRGEFGGKKNE